MFEKVMQIGLSLMHATGSMLIVWPHIARAFRRGSVSTVAARSWFIRRLSMIRTSRRAAHIIVAMAAMLEVTILVSIGLFIEKQKGA